MIITALAAALCMKAQDDREVQLDEVRVEAARIIRKPDGQLILPSDAQKRASTNGYTLLGKLALPKLRVDEVLHTIVYKGNTGQVQLRINNTLASKDDLLALDPMTVKGVDVIDNPGVRYGSDIACVINVRTQRVDEGCTLGFDAVNGLTTWRGDNMAYGRWNRGRSELGMTYDFTYKDFDGNRYSERADYLLADGSTKTVTRADEAARRRSFGHNIQLKYNLADSASYAFQATFSLDMNHDPGSPHALRVISGDQNNLTSTFVQGHDRSPVLDLYFFRQLTPRQSVTANVVGTQIATHEKNYMDEGSPYGYFTRGRTWSLLSEVIYENRLKLLTLSLGLRQRLKYTRNAYSGDVESVNRMHNDGLYFFAEGKGMLHRWGYVAGLGASREHYSQGASRYTYWLFRPKATLTYDIAPAWNWRYSFEISQHISQIAMISDTRIRVNSMEWMVGNPDLKPNRVMTNQLQLSFTKPWLTSRILAEFRMNRHVNMPNFIRSDDNQFLYTQTNQHSCDMIYVRNDMRWEAIHNRLSASIEAGIYRFFNRGDDYRHYLTAYNVGGNLQAYLGRWTLTANADNGWKFMEGETWNRQGAAVYLTCSYRLGAWDLSIYWQHPFERAPKTFHGAVVNRLVHKTMEMRQADLGNMVSINITWKYNRGRQYRAINKRLENKDTQTGVLRQQ